MQISLPEDTAKGFFGWLSEFGTGAQGILVLVLVLTAVVAICCLPRMYRERLEHRKTDKELTLETRRLDLEIAKRMEAITKAARKRGEKP